MTTKVLIVDDSVVVRRLVSQALAADPDVEVVGTAVNGRVALARLDQLGPDVVLLDVEMPEMDGLQTLAELRKKRPTLPVIMFSTLTERGASTTLDALALGASDYVHKPTGAEGVTATLETVREQLLPRIKALGRPPQPLISPAAAALPRRPSPSQYRFLAPVRVVVVGVSTGGPNALVEVISALPADFSVPVLIVQHMPPTFTRLLAERLNGLSEVAVREAAGGERLQAGEVWLAPGDHHLELRGQGADARLLLHQGPPENSCRPAADVLFRSAAAAYGAGVLAVVLTGMGQDGLRGCQDVRAAGGQVIVQDEATSVVWGMPGFVARAGLADRVVPLRDVAAEMMQRVRPRADRARPSAPGT